MGEGEVSHTNVPLICPTFELDPVQIGGRFISNDLDYTRSFGVVKLITKANQLDIGNFGLHVVSKLSC